MAPWWSAIRASIGACLRPADRAERAGLRIRRPPSTRARNRDAFREPSALRAGQPQVRQGGYHRGRPDAIDGASLRQTRRGACSSFRGAHVSQAGEYPYGAVSAAGQGPGPYRPAPRWRLLSGSLPLCVREPLSMSKPTPESIALATPISEADRRWPPGPISAATRPSSGLLPT